jgi:hypothetical protein
MRVQERATDANTFANAIRLGPPVEERASLERTPGESAVEFYFLTEAASRAWSTISATIAAKKGAVFWVAGATGDGKTHFLNYLLALESRASPDRGRGSLIRLEIDARVTAYDLEQRMFESLAREIGVGDAGATLWRRLHGGEALGLALEQAGRVGIRAVTIAIDFGAADASGWNDYFTEMARAAAFSRNTRFDVFVAARDPAPENCVALEVGAAEGDERIALALARARKVVDDTAVSALYGGFDLEGFDPRAIFPCDPRAPDALRAVAGEKASVADLAGIARGALAAWIESGGQATLSALDIMRSAQAANLVELRLGAAGRAARRVAYRAANAMEQRSLARDIVDVLLLRWLQSEQALPVADLRARLVDTRARSAEAGAKIAPIIEALAERTGGVIGLDGGQALFNPHAAGAPEVAAFNNALPLLRRFDSTLPEARDFSDLPVRLTRAGEAMVRGVEEAHRAGAALETAHRELRLDLKPEHRRALDGFVALADPGPAQLVEQARDPEFRIRAERIVADFESIAAAAAAVPRIREMREYLRATALVPDMAEDQQAGDKAVAAAQIECQLLLAALESGVARWEPRGFDALEIRFQKFKWNYIQLYQSAHERWRSDCGHFAIEIAGARDHFAALARLNAIAALGAPAGAELGLRIEDLAGSFARCASDAPLTLDLTPRCARCGFVLGTAPPMSELAETFEQVRRALKMKLAAVSQDAIARLIREHDRGHRLEGFLKITQAAQTDVLVRVLDDNLAHYLARMLEDLREKPEDAVRRVLQPVARTEREASRSGGKRAGRPIKPRPE